MLIAQDPRPIGDHLLAGGDRVAVTARLLVDDREVGAGSERVRMLITDNPHPIGDHHLQEGDRLARTTRLPVGDCEVTADSERVRVLITEDPGGLVGGVAPVADGRGVQASAQQATACQVQQRALAEAPEQVAGVAGEDGGIGAQRVDQVGGAMVVGRPQTQQTVGSGPHDIDQSTNRTGGGVFAGRAGGHSVDAHGPGRVARGMGK
jgi:hypothetical protein